MLSKEGLILLRHCIQWVLNKTSTAVPIGTGKSHLAIVLSVAAVGGRTR